MQCAKTFLICDKYNFLLFFAGSSKYNHKFKAVYNIENEETAFRFTVNVIQWSLIELINDEKAMLTV